MTSPLKEEKDLNANDNLPLLECPSVVPVAVPVIAWKPGDFFRHVQRKIEESDLVKKIRENHAQTLVSVSPSSSAVVPEGIVTRNRPLYDKAMDWKNKRRDESQKRTVEQYVSPNKAVDGSQVSELETFGKVKISSVSMDGIPSWAKRSPYVLFSLESRAQATTRAASKGPYEWSDWFGEMEVSDLWCDLYVVVYAAKAGSQVVALDDEFVGKAIVPLCNIALEYNQPWVRTLFNAKGVRYEKTICVQLLPLNVNAKTYTRCVEGLPSSGMVRPTESLGQVKFTLQIDITVPLAKALLTVPPYRTFAYPPAGEQLNGSILYQRKTRIRQLTVGNVWAFKILVENLLSWQYPFSTWIWLTIYAQLTLFSELHHLPFFICLCVVLGSYFVRMCHVKEGAPPAPIFYADETTLDPEIPQTIGAKIMTLQMVVGGIQRALGIVASLLERMFFALSWEDPFISFLVSIAIIAFGFIVSVVWAILVYTSFIWRPLLFLSGLVFHFPSTTQVAIQRKLQKLLSKALKRNKEITAPISSTPELNSDVPLESLLEDPLIDPAQSVETTDDHQNRRMKKSAREMFKNLLLRLPDAQEVDHRRLAQVHILN